MNNPQKYKKGALLFSAGIILNLLVSAIIFTGASVLTDKGTENSKQVVELTKEKGLTIVENLYSLYKGSSGDVRDDSEQELKMLSLYDALDYDLTLSFNIPDKSINGINYMQVRAETDTLRTIYVNLYNNMKVNSIGFQNMMRTGINYDKARDIQQWDNVTFTQTNNYIIINIGENNVPMKGDIVALKIDYSGRPLKKGFDSFSFKERYVNICIYTLS